MSSGALDLRDHDHVELVADLGDQGDDVVEAPRRVEAVDSRPQLRVAHVDRSATSTRPDAGGLLVGHRDGVFEVAEQDVDGRDDLGQLGDDLVDVRREEVDDTTRSEGDVAHRLRGTDSEGFEEVSGAAHECKGMCRCSQGRNGHDVRVTQRFKAILLDAGGVLVLPDPTVLGPLLSYYGGDPSIERAPSRPLRGHGSKIGGRQR